MLSYESFKESVKEGFVMHLPASFHGMEAVIHPVRKVNNDSLDGLSLMDATAGKFAREKSVSPTIYVNDMYAKYVRTGEFTRTMQYFAGIFEKAFQTAHQIKIPDFKDFSKQVVYNLVNAEKNGEFLKTVPHRRFLDLAVIYRWIMEAGEEGMQSAVITNEMMVMLGLYEEQLHAYACENTGKILPPVLKTMESVFGIPGTGMFPGVPQMFIASNTCCINGAVCMMDKDFLKGIADTVMEDLYILPSSIHECIILPETGSEGAGFLIKMVREVNRDILEEQEYLSDSVYHFKRSTGKIICISEYE